MQSVPVVIMEELADNKVGFLECLKVVLPDTVFLDGLVECFDIRIMIRPILSSNFMPYSVHLQCTDKSIRRVLRSTITPYCQTRMRRQRNDSIWKPFQYCHFQCPYSFICTTIGTECVCQPFSGVTVQDTKQIAPPIMATPDIGYILLSKLVLSFRYCKDPLHDNMLSDTSLPDKISKFHETIHLLSIYCCYPTSVKHGCYSPNPIGGILQCHFFYCFK